MDDILLSEKDSLPKNFSLINEYNLHRQRIGQKYPICWAHSIADMITDTFQIYHIEFKKNNCDFEPPPKRTKGSSSSCSTTRIDMSKIEYVYISSLIWTLSYKDIRIYKKYIRGEDTIKVIKDLFEKKFQYLVKNVILSKRHCIKFYIMSIHRRIKE